MVWPTDLVVTRDLLFHFDQKRIMRVLHRLSASGARYLLSTFYPLKTNEGDLRKTYSDGLGHFAFWPINLAAPPFSLGPPLLTVGMDGSAWDRAIDQRAMGLWALPLWSDS